MERVWILSNALYEKRESFPIFRLADLAFVKSIGHLNQSLDPSERLVILGDLQDIRKSEEAFAKRILATWLLPNDPSFEQINLAVRCVLHEARLQHDLEAAENIAWSGGGSGQYDDPSIEFLGESVLEISGCRNMAAVETAILHACERVAPTEEVHVVAHPEYASSRVLGRYQLAVPIQFQGVLKAHIYARFPDQVLQDEKEKVGEALLNLSDAVALAVERNQMISKAEETKTVWEASFDAVADPVAILDDEYKIVRANRAYAKLLGLGVSKMQGKEADLVARSVLEYLPKDKNSEWELTHNEFTYRAYFDPILDTLGAGHFVLRLHDVTKERSLTEKILAKEQVAEMGILIGSVAHEINNPIGGILAICQLLLGDNIQDPALKEDIANISASAERCKKIVQTMLSLVRKSDEEKMDLHLGDCMHQAIDLLSSEATRLKIKFHFDEKKDAAQRAVHANKNRLLQVFFHLVQQSMNAIAERKKREKLDGSIRLLVYTRKDELLAEIEDNGDPAKHDYEIESPVAFTVSRMILEEHGARYEFERLENANIQRLIFPALPQGNAL